MGGKPDRLSSENAVHLKAGRTLADSEIQCTWTIKLSLLFRLHNKKPGGPSPFVSPGSIRVRIKAWGVMRFDLPEPGSLKKGLRWKSISNFQRSACSLAFRIILS